MNFRACGLAFGLGVFGALSASAATVSIATDEGILMSTQHGIRENTSTTGRDLAGMGVQVNFADGSSESLVWEAYDAYTQGGTSTTDFSLRASWDGFRLNTSRVLTSMTFFAATANAVFDMLTVNDGQPGDTHTTKIGFPFRIQGEDTLEGNIHVSYANAVVLAGHPQGADAFTDMTMDFTGLAGGGFSGSLFFNSDMDSLAVAGDLVPVPVPLPAGLPLLLGALGGLALLRRGRAATRA